MRIRKPTSITVPQLMIVTAVGVISGLYIYQPLFLRHKKDLAEKKELKLVSQVQDKE